MLVRLSSPKRIRITRKNRLYQIRWVTLDAVCAEIIIRLTEWQDDLDF